MLICMQGGINMVESINQICKNLAEELNLTSMEHNKISTGFVDLDNLFGEGLNNKPNLICLAACPAMGKTTMALDIALNTAMSSGKDVYIFSLELSKEQAVDRLLIKMCGFNGRYIVRNKGELTDVMKYKISSALKTLSELNIFIYDECYLTVNDIKSKIKEIDKTALIVIDYLQLMSVEKDTDVSQVLQQNQRTIEMEILIKDLATLTKEINIPIVAVTQIRRFTADRKDRRPLMSDLGLEALEREPDTIIMLYRDYKVRGSWTRGFGHDVLSDETELFVHKNRYGNLGTIKINFNQQFLKFE